MTRVLDARPGGVIRSASRSREQGSVEPQALTGCPRAIRSFSNSGDRFGVFAFFMFFPESLS